MFHFICIMENCNYILYTVLNWIILREARGLTSTYYNSTVMGVDMNPVAGVRVTLQPWCYGPRPLVFGVSWSFL